MNALSKRPRATWEPSGKWAYQKHNPRTLFVPYVLGDSTKNVKWLTFKVKRSAECYFDAKCQICGVEVPAGERVYINEAAAEADADPYTSGPATHASCALYALKHCPHFGNVTDDMPVAWLWIDSGQGFGARGTLSTRDVNDMLTDPDPMFTGPKEGAVHITLAELKEFARATPPVGCPVKH